MEALSPKQRLALAAGIILALTAAVGAAVYVNSQGPCSDNPPMPPASSGKADFVIVANLTGFNNSARYGVPACSWPIIHVAKGTIVNITVYNEDKQTHSFQVAHYFDNGIQTIAPGEKLNVSFVANDTGTFSMKCVIPCSIHWAMQSGELVVT